jgi:PAS domain S-box-containing protein
MMSTSSNQTQLPADRTEPDQVGQVHPALVEGVESLPIPIFVFDRHGIVQVWNEAVARLTGVSEREALGNPLPDRFTAPSKSTLEAMAASEVAPRPMELGILDEEGTQHVLRCAISALAAGAGGIGGVLVVGMAASAVDSGECTGGERTRVEASARVIGGVVHSFNNILTVLTCNLTLMEQHPATEADNDLRQLILDATRAAEEAVALITSLKEYVGGGEEVRGQCDVGEVFTEAGTTLGENLPPGIELRFAPESGTQVAISGEDLLGILSHLVKNASEAMAEGGPIEVGTEPSATKSGHSEVTVRDTGCGFSAEHEHLLTEPFFTTKRPARGAGLGLAMVERFVRGAAGDLRIEVLPNGWTLVRVTLPNAPGNTNSEGTR